MAKHPRSICCRRRVVIQDLMASRYTGFFSTWALLYMSDFDQACPRSRKLPTGCVPSHSCVHDTLCSPTCCTPGGTCVMPGSSGQGPKSYLLQKACADEGSTSTKHTRVSRSSGVSSRGCKKGTTPLQPSSCMQRRVSDSLPILHSDGILPS